MFKYMIPMAALIVAGCQTTKADTPVETVNEPVVVQQQKETPLLDVNPFEGKSIRPNQMVHSRKPVVCGRADTILNNIMLKYGEKPVFMGESEAARPHDNKPIKLMVTLTYNSKTGSWTLFEQMPMEERLLCMLSGGTGKFSSNIVQGSAL